MSRPPSVGAADATTKFDQYVRAFSEIMEKEDLEDAKRAEQIMDRIKQIGLDEINKFDRVGASTFLDEMEFQQKVAQQRLKPNSPDPIDGRIVSVMQELIPLLQKNGAKRANEILHSH